MNLKLSYLKFILYTFLAIFAFYVNYFYSNLGLYPIDTFSFFDTGYLITRGYHPIKDYWVISGIFIDYTQSLFFYIFGANWKAYVYHSSFVNAGIAIFFFFFLNKFLKNLIFNFSLSLSFAVLCYPVAGTPFPYQHSLILSLASIMIFYLAIYENKKIYWILLPVLMVVSFLSMQLPSSLINLIIITSIIIHYILTDKKFLKHFLTGCFFVIIIFIFYFLFTKVEIKDFFIQMILFPLDIGSSRVLGDEKAFESANLFKKLTFRGIVGHFKFINIFIFLNILAFIFLWKRKKKLFKFDRKIYANFLVLLCSISFIFHQLITANQTFIFSLIPVLCGFFVIQIKEFFEITNKKIEYFILIFIFLVTLKYHDVYNSKRKFMDLQNVNLEQAINAEELNIKLKKLKWITPFDFSKNPKEEIDLLNQALLEISKSDKEVMVITHYQFFSTILEKNLNIPNRWYFPGNNTYPSNKESKYRDHYQKKFIKILDNKNIKTIYVIEGRKNEMKKFDFKYLLKDKCFSKNIRSKIFYEINIKKCY